MKRVDLDGCEFCDFRARVDPKGLAQPQHFTD